MAFNLAINETGVTKTFFDGMGVAWTVEQNVAVDISHIHTRSLRPIGNFLEEMDRKGIRRFYLQRSFSIGDVLMVVPVIRYLRTLGYSPYIVTSKVFYEVLHALGIEVMSIEGKRYSDYGLILDGTVERDHVRKTLQKFHRVHIYMMALGIDNLPRRVDWSCDLNNFKSIEDEFIESPYIVFQGKGSGRKKSLQDDAIRFIIRKLNENGIRVAFIGNKFSAEGIDGEMSRLFFRDLSLSQLFTLIGKSDLLISMDSSPLWISHFTETPVIAILGPSRPSERISLHPFYPDAAMAVQLNRTIKCKSCFEVSEKCHDEISCLKISPERIYKEICRKLESMMR